MHGQDCRSLGNDMHSVVSQRGVRKIRCCGPKLRNMHRVAASLSWTERLRAFANHGREEGNPFVDMTLLNDLATCKPVDRAAWLDSRCNMQKATSQNDVLRVTSAA